MPVRKRMGPLLGPRAANVAETLECILRATVEQQGYTGARVDAICKLGYVNFIASAAIAPPTILFAPLDARIAHSIPQQTLRLCFGVLLFATSIRMSWSLLS